jgi:hypothetical protein
MKSTQCCFVRLGIVLTGIASSGFARADYTFKPFVYAGSMQMPAWSINRWLEILGNASASKEGVGFIYALASNSFNAAAAQSGKKLTRRTKSSSTPLSFANRLPARCENSVTRRY